MYYMAENLQIRHEEIANHISPNASVLLPSGGVREQLTTELR